MGWIISVRRPTADFVPRQNHPLMTYVCSLLQPLVTNGGPTGAVAAFLFVIAGVLTQVLVMAELASMLVFLMSRRNKKLILSGFLYLMANITGITPKPYEL